MLNILIIQALAGKKLVRAKVLIRVSAKEWDAAHGRPVRYVQG